VFEDMKLGNTVNDEKEDEEIFRHAGLQQLNKA